MMVREFSCLSLRRWCEVLLVCGLLWLPSLRVGMMAAQAGENSHEEEGTLTHLDGRQEDGVVREITADGEVFYRSANGSENKVSLMALRRIERGSSIARVPSCAVYLAAKRGVLRVDEIEISEKKCALTWDASPALTLPLTMIEAVVFAGKQLKISRPLVAARFNEERGQTATEDRLVVVSKGKVKIVRGVLVGVDADKVTFLFREKERLVAREKVYGIILAQAAHVSLTKYRGAVRVSLRDGSTFWARVNSLSGGRFFLQADKITLPLPWALVSRLDVWSTRLDFVSDLTPSSVQQSSIVSFPTTYQRDRSVLGRPLTLGTVQYDKGLGVHARSVLTYDLAGQYKHFAATLGIDAETAGKGDCIFRVLADGREIFKQRLRGSDRPLAMQVDIVGVESLVLEVDPGADLDLADHANWCDARLIR